MIKIKSAFTSALFFLAMMLISFVSLQSATAQDENYIHYPRPEFNVDPNEAYINELFALIIHHSPIQYKIISATARMDQKRSIFEMTKEKGIVDVMWSMTTDEREKTLIPIRLPIDKGLLGYRILLIDKKNKHLFDSVHSLNDLQKYSSGQGNDWPDVEILRANNIKVFTSNQYKPLFKMLVNQRFDNFPRSVIEYEADLNNHKNSNIIADENIVLIYPTAYYFFVTPRRPLLAKNIEIGFEKIIENGSFEKLFLKYHQEIIEKANIENRTQIHLKNPLLNSKSLPLHRSKLWFNNSNPK